MTWKPIKVRSNPRALQVQKALKREKCDYCGNEYPSYKLQKLPNKLLRCSMCETPEKRKLNKSKVAVKEDEGVIETPNRKLIATPEEYLKERNK